MTKYIYGIDIGGTTVKMGLFDEKGDMLEKWEIVTRKENNGENILPDIVKSIKEKNTEKSIETDDILGIGMGVPGPITEDGRVLKCANLGWGIFSVADEMSKLTGVEKVKVGNDANVAALGEQWRGGGRGFDNIVMVTLGTGVGGGIIMDGKILTGENGAAGEIGHITVNPKETLTCGCGCKGCLEQYSSATGVIRMAKERLEASDKPSELRKFAADEIGGKEVFDAYKAGDELAAEAVNEFAIYLGMGLGNVASVVDTQAFVIGGGLSKNGPVVIDIVKEQYKKNVMFALKNTEFRLAELGNDAGMYGAVRMVLQ
ncbi:MAG: ROK family glucokinase [Butyribacter sp.]|jgi:glucokinase|uniref:ROK family glucokinase n=1 Tax=Clostridia TaxID=186801 RepID=UPI000969C301|nr:MULTISPECIES: ROK family glucokinase [unclassified Clostridium]MBS5363953.1 ROK family glucokinase [Clostridium sp.]MCQ5166950.1 ROK family glucokinase [Roseburia hominis]OKZ80369.1 MAG: glucokinase [Clostridium sp. CAG:12237_41]RHP24537.1 ROK family protein [Clostridium sp. AF34-13]RHT90525.1 ROK family protein [Clostridium sp. AM27-31LB]